MKSPEAERLGSNVGSLAALDATDAKDEHDGAIEKRVIKAGVSDCEFKCSEKRGRVCKSASPRFPYFVESEWKEARSGGPFLNLEPGPAFFPLVDEGEKRKGKEKGDPPLGRALAADGDARAAEEVKGGFASDHREYGLVGEGFGLPVGFFQDDFVIADFLERGFHREPDRTRRVISAHFGMRGGGDAFGDGTGNGDRSFRILFEHADFLDIAGFGAGKFFFPVA